jgi:hypothetical protein
MKADFLSAVKEKPFQKDYIFRQFFTFFNGFCWRASTASYISESLGCVYKTVSESRSEIV